MIEHTDNASDTFYFMGTKDFAQTYTQHALFFGVDSKFAESLVVEFKDVRFELPIVNGCAILRTKELPLNTFGVMKIHVSSNDKTQTYERALVHAGDNIGFLHQQYVIIDTDFDGVEDLYDDEINLVSINQEYADYQSRFPNHRTDQYINWYLGSIARRLDITTTHKLSDHNFKVTKIGNRIEIHYDKKNGYYIKNSMHICTSSVDIIVITPVNFYIKIAKKFLNNLLTTNNNYFRKLILCGVIVV